MSSSARKLATTAATSRSFSSSSSNALFSVAGKKVLITGGSRGIGLMIAQGFVEAGAHVLLTSRSEDACKEAVQNLRDQQQKALVGDHGELPFCNYVVSNLSTRSGCEDLAVQVAKVFDNELHVLVNNAGTSWGEPISRNSSSRSNWGFDKVLDLNVKSIFYLTRACHEMLKNGASAADKNIDSSASSTESDQSASASAGRSYIDVADPARIINIGSIAGIQPQQAPTHAYDISKAAVHQLTRKFAADFAADNITVNALAPGYVPSRMSDGLASWGGDKDNLAKQIPLQRLGTMEDMSGACIYLSSRAGAWCTGVVLNVDGGAVGAAQIPLSSL